MRFFRRLLFSAIFSGKNSNLSFSNDLERSICSTVESRYSDSVPRTSDFPRYGDFFAADQFLMFQIGQKLPQNNDFPYLKSSKY